MIVISYPSGRVPKERGCSNPFVFLFVCFLQDYKKQQQGLKVMQNDNLQFFDRGGGGGSWEFLIGVCNLVLKILTLFQTKKCHFPHLFLDQTPKTIPFFSPGLETEIMPSLLRLERKQKYSSNPYRIRIFLFLSYSFGLKP